MRLSFLLSLLFIAVCAAVFVTMAIGEWAPAAWVFFVFVGIHWVFKHKVNG